MSLSLALKKFFFLPSLNSLKYACVVFFIGTTTAYSSQNQMLQHLVYEIRNPQTNAPQFRDALEKIGEYLALRVLEDMNKSEVKVRTLTETHATHLLVDEVPVLVTILRAGLPLNNGVQKVFKSSPVGFLAMSRDEETLKAKLDYVALPKLANQTVIITDTMLATGGSLIDTIKLIEEFKPRRIFVIAAIASEPGIAHVLKAYPNVQIVAAVIDPKLNEKGYIIPGLGDAGDRSYGIKHHHKD